MRPAVLVLAVLVASASIAAAQNPLGTRSTTLTTCDAAGIGRVTLTADGPAVTVLAAVPAATTKHKIGQGGRLAWAGRRGDRDVQGATGKIGNASKKIP